MNKGSVIDVGSVRAPVVFPFGSVARLPGGTQGPRVDVRAYSLREALRICRQWVAPRWKLYLRREPYASFVGAEHSRGMFFGGV